jgi:hypothetical protein
MAATSALAFSGGAQTPHPASSMMSQVSPAMTPSTGTPAAMISNTLLGIVSRKRGRSRRHTAETSVAW